MSKCTHASTKFRPLLLAVAVAVVLIAGCARTSSIATHIKSKGTPALADARSSLSASDGLGAAIFEQSDTRVAQADLVYKMAQADEEALQVDNLGLFVSESRLAQRSTQVIVSGETLQPQPEPTGYATAEQQPD